MFTLYRFYTDNVLINVKYMTNNTILIAMIKLIFNMSVCIKNEKNL